MEKEQLEKLLEVINKFSKKREELKNNRPCHFNVLDEAGVKENAHNRIIGAILKYKVDGKFINLQSFYDSLGLDLKICNPKIKVEKYRIDISIMDDEYSIIIENKIHNAVDQDKQIDTYLDVIKGIKGNKDIYVYYLTRFGIKEVSEKSLSIKSRDELGGKFKPINFRYHILCWLKEYVLPNCKYKDEELINGLKQYINHLEGLLRLRKKDKKMNEELSEHLKELLEIKDNKLGTLKTLTEKINQTNTLSSELCRMKKDIKEELRRTFLEALLFKINELDKGNWEPVTFVYNKSNLEEANFRNFGFRNKQYIYKSDVKNEGIYFSIEIQNHNRFLCGFFVKHKSNIEIIQRDIDTDLRLKNDINWIYIDFNEYNGIPHPIGIYNDDWDENFINNMDKTVEAFYEPIERLFNKWREFNS